MKRFIIILIILSLVLSLATGCSYYTDEIPENVTIYTLERETFFHFLREGDQKALMQNCIYYNECEPKKTFHAADGSDLYLSPDFFDFLNSPSAIERYLTEHEIQEKVKDHAILDVDSIPLSIWIKTGKNTYYLTVDENVYGFSVEHDYCLYTQAEYKVKFGENEALLRVQGKPVPGHATVKRYYKNADFPLEAVLISLGASSLKTGKQKKEIRFLDEVYILDNKKCALYNEDGDDVLHWFAGGGMFHIYKNMGTVYIEKYGLNAVLSSIGMPVSITYDPATNVMDISPRTD